MNARRIILPNAIRLGEATRMLEEGHSVTIMTKGNSMSPFIRGERDSVTLVKKEKVEVGDIALCHLGNGRYVLHRVNAINGDKVRLKGDGNLDATEACTLSDVCGVVSVILRGEKPRFRCDSPCFKRASRRWVRAPRIVRRICLGIYRRIKIL